MWRVVRREEVLKVRTSNINHKLTENIVRHQVWSVLRLECFSIVRIVVSGVLSDRGHPVTGASLINHPADCLLSSPPPAQSPHNSIKMSASHRLLTSPVLARISATFFWHEKFDGNLTFLSDDPVSLPLVDYQCMDSENISIFHSDIHLRCSHLQPAEVLVSERVEITEPLTSLTISV